jgi:ribosome maturation factor RimP
MSDRIEEFVEEYSGAPYELHEFAEGAVDVEDCPDLVEAAQAYLDAKEAFINMLEEHGVEQG